MASFRLNIARIRGCPAPRQLGGAMEAFGLPQDQEFGVLNWSTSDSIASATIVRKTQTAVQRLDSDTKEVTASPVERVTLYPFAVRPRQETLEIYAGSAGAIEQVGLFLSGPLGLSTVVEPIELDLVEALGKLAGLTQRFVLRNVRVSDYSHNAYMTGPYAPKFLDTEHGKEFLEEYAAGATSAGVKFRGPTGPATVSLGRSACFGFSCRDDDQAAIQAILRKLV
jgi:hypothetical protein